VLVFRRQIEAATQPLVKGGVVAALSIREDDVVIVGLSALMYEPKIWPVTASVMRLVVILLIIAARPVIIIVVVRHSALLSQRLRLLMEFVVL